MKKIIFIFSLFLSSVAIANGNGGTNPDKPETNNSDTSVSLKNNIVIFKLIPTPSTSNGSSGSLKKAGKVARTSSKPHAIVDSSFVYRKRPI
ncbi:MAG: hypothetical protein J0L87_11980 [Bacteroidetes bacterium]|nr:hypothetical protein [Bacteroidota bacterium]